jgi:hypothetical protein
MVVYDSVVPGYCIPYSVYQILVHTVQTSVDCLLVYITMGARGSIVG